MKDCYICEALDPNDPTGAKATVYLPEKLVENLQDRSPVMLMNIKLVQETLLEPDAVFAGTRKHNDGGLCYVKRYDGSTEIYKSREIKVPFPPGHLSCVYLNNRSAIYSWRFERESPESPGSPEDAGERFQGKVWP